MSLVFKRNPVWLESFPLGEGDANEALVLLGGDDCEVSVSAVLLLAASPLVRRIMLGVPLALSSSMISIPSATGAVLRDVKEILTRGAADMNRRRVSEVQEVLRLMEVEAFSIEDQYMDYSAYLNVKLEEDITATISLDDIIETDEEANEVTGSDTIEEKDNYSRCGKGKKELVKMSDPLTEDVLEFEWGVNSLTKSGQLKQPGIDESFRVDGSESLKTRIEENEGIMCTLCVKQFCDQFSLSRHLQIVHLGKKDYQCVQCHKAFSQKANLKRHNIAVHEKENVNVNNCELEEKRDDNKCIQCEKVFSRKDSLKKHVHEKCELEKKEIHKCIHCDKVFSQKANLGRHTMLVHEQEKYEECGECGVKFGRTSLRQHRKRIHGFDEPKLFECHICHRNYKTKQSLKTHIQFVHEKVKLFSCDTCEIRFSEISKLNRHFVSAQHSAKTKEQVLKMIEMK